MSPRHLSILAVFLASAPVLHAVRPRPVEADATATADAPVKAGAKAETKADASAKSEPAPPYELKNRSAFTIPANTTRPPFWPIGWVKRVVGAPVQFQEVPVAPKVLLDEKSFTVTSILVSSGTTPSLAVINHRAYSEGEFIRMPKTPGAPPLRIRVQRIVDGVVTLQNGGQTLTIPLQRMELSNKRPEELLLDPDR